jgi:hypothetical protein
MPLSSFKVATQTFSLEKRGFDYLEVVVAFPGANLDNILIKLNSTNMVMQALVARLRAKGLLDEADIIEMKGKTSEYVGFLREHSGSGAQVAAVRIQADLDVFFEVLTRS